MARSPQRETARADLPPAPKAAYAKQIREWLGAQRAQLKTAYLARPQPDRNLRQHAAVVDAAIARIATDIGMPASCALAAVGGYGRGFLFPASDVDVVVLLPDAGSTEPRFSEIIEQFVSLLWDVGLEPGIAVRTVAECVDEAVKDVTVDTSMLEARAVWGDQTLVDRLRAALTKARSLQKFFDAKIDEQRRRHARHNDVALNLEPNIKESPGGLRDMQTVLWLSKAAGLGEDWKDLADAGLITPYESKLILRHRRTLIDLRIRLHYLAGRREDRLVFDYQTALAKELRIDAPKGKLASEILTRRYYLAAKGIWQMNSILLPTLLGQIAQGRRDVVKRIDDEFDLVNGNIAARDEKIFRRDPRAIFRAFLALQSVHEAEFFEPGTLRALWRSVYLIDKAFRDDPEANRLFLKILQSEKVTFNLRRMSRYGILGRYIPAFGRIVGQMQHDLFHVYSVDEHIMMVIRNLRRLVLPRFSHEFPFCHELAQEFARPEVLYLAALFHDIAKGRGGDHSELGKKDARQFCRRLNVSKSDTDLVAWLVEMHLQMSAVAQKQDLSDPEVISQFAQRVGNERRLTALYLLTVADIRGTSPHVWNAWKGKLLEQLFRATRRLLRGDAMPNEFWIENRKHEALQLYREHVSTDSAATPALWTHTDPSYFQRFEASEIAWHAVELENDTAPAHAVVKVRIPDADNPEQGYRVMVMCRDQPGLFARITGYFEKLAFDIAAAKVYTTVHGYALDAFQILPKSATATRYKDLAGTIERDLARLLDDLASPMTMPSGRMARQVKHFPIEPAISLHPWRQKPYYELTVSCADRPGLLSAIARVLFDCGVNLHDARITTLGQRAEDVFIVEQKKLADAAFAAQFQDRLSRELRPTQ
jgi:[protein-PII] uridylyltransferase